MVEKKKRKSLGSGKKRKTPEGGDSSPVTQAEATKEPEKVWARSKKKKKGIQQQNSGKPENAKAATMQVEDNDENPKAMNADTETDAMEAFIPHNEMNEENENSKESSEGQEQKQKQVFLDDSNHFYDKTDIDSLIVNFSKEDLADLLKAAFEKYPDLIKDYSQTVAKDPLKRKVFVRGLSWNTTSETLHKAFESFGEIEKAEVVTNKSDGKSRGYGFVTYKTLAGTLRAVSKPRKTIDGRVAVALLSSAGSESASQSRDQRKIYIGGLNEDINVDKLVKLFLQYGEIEEGPLGFDKQTGKCKGFTFFIYKTAESAKKALKQPNKKLDGLKLHCKYADRKDKSFMAPSKSYVSKGLQVAHVSPIVPPTLLGGDPVFQHMFPHTWPYY